MCGIVDAGAYNFVAFFLPPTTTSHSNTLATPRKWLFSILGHFLCVLSLSLLSGTGALAFFSQFDQTCDQGLILIGEY